MRQRSRLLVLSGLFATIVLSLSFSYAAQATSLTLSGGWSYQYGTNTVTLTVGKITNNATGGNSGSLRLELWAFSSPYDGTAMPGYRLAQHQLSVLNGGSAYNNVSSGSITATLPPTGTWHMALLLTEYNGSSFVVRHYLLTTKGQTLVCTSASCSVVEPPPAAARAEVSSNSSHYTLNKEDTLLLSGIIEAGDAAGTASDIYIRVSLNGGAPLYLGSDMQWNGVEKPIVSQFSLTDVIVPNFYSLPSNILPEGVYKFEILVANSHQQSNALHSLIAHAEVLTTVWPNPVVDISPPETEFIGTVGEPFSYNFAPWVTGGTPPYYFILGTFGGFPPMGIVLQPNGMLTGTPTIKSNAFGPSRFLVCAVDMAANQTRDCAHISILVIEDETPPSPPPPAGTYLFANWTCGSSGQCAAIMGAPQGSTGMFCALADCNSWGMQTIPAGYSCSATASVANPRISTGSNGQCNRAGVDF